MTIDADEAVRRLRRDRAVLESELARHDPDRLQNPYHLASGPLGDFCESLHDLVAHVLMWDEISLAVLADAQRRRPHWSLDDRWETPQAGQALNRAGVAAGRHFTSAGLLHRYASTNTALVDELERVAADGWSAPLELDPSPAASLGALAEYVMTVPGQPAYWHAAVHLARLPGAQDAPAVAGRP